MKAKSSKARRSRTLDFNAPPTLVAVAARDERAAGLEPPRGVKLKTVSNFVMVTAILCLLAFLAGQSPNTAGAAEGLPGNLASPAAAAAPSVFTRTIPTR